MLKTLFLICFCLTANTALAQKTSHSKPKNTQKSTKKTAKKVKFTTPVVVEDKQSAAVIEPVFGNPKSDNKSTAGTLSTVATKTKNRNWAMKNPTKGAKKWRYESIGVQDARVLEFTPASFECADPLFSAAVCIIKTQQGDTLRLLDFCNTSVGKIEVGQMYRIIPLFEPNADIFLPNLPSVFDEKTRRTAFGKAIY